MSWPSEKDLHGQATELRRQAKLVLRHHGVLDDDQTEALAAALWEAADMLQAAADPITVTTGPVVRIRDDARD